MAAQGLLFGLRPVVGLMISKRPTQMRRDDKGYGVSPAKVKGLAILYVKADGSADCAGIVEGEFLQKEQKSHSLESLLEKWRLREL